MSLPVSTSRELQDLIAELSPHCGGDEVSFPGDEFDGLVRRLSLIRKLAITEERELGAYRLADAARHGRSTVDQLAAEQFDGLVRDVDDKIVRPDFGRKA